MLAVFGNPYLATLKKKYTGYATRSTMDLIAHIYEHYGRISSTDMAANEKRLRSSYSAEEPLESLIEKLNECTDLATTASEPVLETQLVHIEYGLVTETVKYPEECRY